MASNSEIVEKAAEIIRDHGWHKGNFGNKQDGYCLVGAGRRAQSLLGHPKYAVNAALSIAPGIRVELSASLSLTEGVYMYNDHYCTSKDEALGVLDRAAKYWRNKGE